MKQPKIRLKGFSGEWEETIIEKVAPLQRGFDLPTHTIVAGHIPVAYSNGILNYHNKGKCKAPAVVTGRSGTIGKFTYIPSGYYWPHNTSLWVTNFFDNNPLFIYYLFHTIHFENYASGSGVPTLNRNDLHCIKISIPNKDEQQALGSYFRHLDSLIQSTTKKIESLKQVKAASLQSMFPQEGETTPRVRFKGFGGEWEKVTFDKAFDFIQNNSLSRDQLSDTDGEVKNVHYGDVLIKFGDIIDVSRDSLPYIKGLKRKNRLSQTVNLQDGDVIITDAAEDNTVGKCSEIVNVKEECVVAGLHTIPCRPIMPFALGYLGHYINSSSYHNQLLPLIQGSKISSISKSVIKLTTIIFPSYDEQTAIASYFTSLDSQITLQTQRLEKLKQIKSACLDNMFV